MHPLFPSFLATKSLEYPSANRQEVCGSFAAHTDGQIRETMQEAIEKIIADAEVMPKNFHAWWAAADDSRRQMLLQGIDAGADEFAVTKPIPGRVQQRIRHVLANGGTSCPAFERVKARSNSVLCRAVNHADPTELIVVSESRYEPASEMLSSPLAPEHSAPCHPKRNRWQSRLWMTIRTVQMLRRT